MCYRVAWLAAAAASQRPVPLRPTMLTAILSSLCVVAAPLPSSRISLVPTVLLKNAAEPGTKMPATGLGTGCAIGGCKVAAPQPYASLNMSKQWISIGGRRFDGADSYGVVSCTTLFSTSSPAG